MNTPDVLQIHKDLLPYECSILLAGELFGLQFNYNASAGVSLYGCLPCMVLESIFFQTNWSCLIFAGQREELNPFIRILSSAVVFG